MAIKNAFRSIQRLIEHFRPDIIAAYAAGAALFIIISFFPFIIMVLSLLRYLPFTEAELCENAFGFVPGQIQELIVNVIGEVSKSNSAIIFPVAAVTGLWSASAGFVSLSRGLNVAYGRKETRSYFRIRGICIVYTAIFLAVIFTVLCLVVFGKVIVSWTSTIYPSFSEMYMRITESRTIPTFIILTLFFTLLYKTIPDRKTRWYAEIPGAALAAFMWLLFSSLYSLYIANFGRYSTVYGSLAAVVLLMMWLYFCMYILFIGAYINRMLKRTRFSLYISLNEDEEKGEDKSPDNASS